METRKRGWMRAVSTLDLVAKIQSSSVAFKECTAHFEKKISNISLNISKSFCTGKF
jgi:hypothetical protein